MKELKKMNKMVPPEMAEMLVSKVLEAVKEGKVKNVSLSVEMEGEGEEEGEMEEEGEEGEVCPECGEEMVVKGKNSYCPECGYEERKKNPDAQVEGSNKEKAYQMENKRDAMMKDEMRDAFSNVEKLKQYSKRK